MGDEYSLQIRDRQGLDASVIRSLGASDYSRSGVNKVR